MIFLASITLGLAQAHRDCDCMQGPVASKAAQRKQQASCFQPAVQSESTTPSCESLPAQSERTTLSLPTAMGLYGLTDSKLFTELQTDTRCLLTWSAAKIVITFRGTASMKNARADLQVSCTSA